MSKQTAGEIIAAELQGLCTPSAGFVAAAMEPTVSNVGDSPAAPQIDPNEAKVLAFIRICRVTDGLTYREITGGTGLQIADVRRALDSLVHNGTLKRSTESETEANRCRYSLAVAEPEPVKPAAQILTQRERDAIADRAAGLEEFRRTHPQQLEVRKPELSDAELQAILDEEAAKKTTIVLTADQLRELRLTEGRVPRNPQAFIRR